MSQQQTFDRIVESLHEATFDVSRWAATSLLIDEAMGSKGNGLLVGQSGEVTVSVRYEGLFWRGERQEAIEREYLEHYHPSDERVARLRQLPDGRVVAVSELYSTDELKTSRTYNEIIPRSIGQSGLNARLVLSPDSHLTFCIGESLLGNPWESWQVNMIQGLLPHVRHFARVRQALVGGEALGVPLDGLLNNTRFGVVHLDRSGRIVAANDRARGILARDTGLQWAGGKLRPCLPGDRVNFERLLARAMPTGNLQAAGGSMVIRSSRIPLVLRVTPVTVPYMAFTGTPGGALVLILEVTNRPKPDARRIAVVLGLTPTEGRVAVLLARGRTVNDIATALGRRQGTVRTHLKSIHRKLGISRRAELVRLVLTADTVLDTGRL